MNRSVGIFLVLFISLTITAQNKFSVPILNDQQKYQNAALLLNGSFLIQISYGKSLGKSVEEIAIFAGDQLKSSWNKQGGFQGFVQNTLYMMLTIAPYGNIEILQQNDNEIRCIVKGLYGELKEGGTIFNVTYDEYIRFLGKMFSEIGDSMHADYSQNITDDGLIFIISKV